jgi:hypothetical protein
VKLQFKTVSVTISGDYYQVIFHDDLDADDEPYFLMQRQFELPDDGVCYFESHRDELIDHCKAKLVSLSKNMLCLTYAEKQPRKIEFSYRFDCSEFRNLASIQKKMIRETKIDA